jgi:hypothetical protein
MTDRRTRRQAQRNTPAPAVAAGSQPAAESETGLGLGLIVLLAAALRIPLLFITPGIDYPFYLSLGRLSDLGFLPYRDYWLEYPPVFPWLALLAYRFVLLFPPAIRYLWEMDTLAPTFHVVLGSVMVVADLCGIALVGSICRQLWPRAEAERRTIVYACLFWPIVVAIGWYDTLPCTMLLLGLWLILRARAGAAGAVAGLGFMTKIFPALLVPIAIKFLPQRRSQVRALVGAVVVTLVIALPMFLLGPAYFIASYRVVFNRSAWETVWALVDGYFSYGKVAPLGVRFDPSTADYVAFESHVPSLPLTILFGLLYVGFWLRPVRRTARNIVLFTAISMFGFLIYSKGYSPQFVVYALPFMVILLPWRRALGYTFALSIFNFIQWPLYHEWFNQVAWVLSIGVIGRTVILIALSWEWLAELWQLRNPLLTWRPDRRLVLAASTVLAVAILVLSVVTWQTWSTRYYDTNHLKPAFDFATRHDPAPDGRAAYIFANHELYEAFHPFFASNADFYLLRPEQAGDDPLKNARLTPEGRQAEMTSIARDHAQIFFIRNADDWTSRDLNTWLTDHAQLDAATRVGNADLSFWHVGAAGR